MDRKCKKWCGSSSRNFILKSCRALVHCSSPEATGLHHVVGRSSVGMQEFFSFPAEKCSSSPFGKGQGGGRLADGQATGFHISGIRTYITHRILLYFFTACPQQQKMDLKRIRKRNRKPRYRQLLFLATRIKLHKYKYRKASHSFRAGIR